MLGENSIISVMLSFLFNSNNTSGNSFSFENDAIVFYSFAMLLLIITLPAISKGSSCTPLLSKLLVSSFSADDNDDSSSKIFSYNKLYEWDTFIMH